MATFDIQKAVKALKHPGIKNILSPFLTELTKDERILVLSNRVAELEERVDECEKYSLKECLIIENLPVVKTRGNVPLLKQQVCDFLHTY